MFSYDCATCSYSNYGLDCRNNAFAFSDAPLSNWDMADKHGLGPSALEDIRRFLPDWVDDLATDKISDIIASMHADHQWGRECERRDAKDFLGCDWWEVRP